MVKRNWRRVRATSVPHAMELLVQHAKEVKGLSVDQIAELIGLTNKYMIYKWVESGRMPTILIRPFEHACGATFLTDYLGLSAHKLLIDIPHGSKGQREIADLQRSFSYAISHLLEFYEEGAEPEKTLAALTDVLKGAAWHRENVTKCVGSPELELFEEAE